MMIARPECQNFTRHEFPGCAPKAISSERRIFEILLVDDDPNILSTLSASLEDSTHHVTTAFGGQKALDVLQQTFFDLVITDFNMPGVDGIAVLRRAKEIHSNTKVIIMTASVIPNATRPLVFREANGFLSKPFGLTELDKTVASCLGAETLKSNLCNETSCSPAAEALSP
jgi:CheY-like chemotaxis protein